MCLSCRACWLGYALTRPDGAQVKCSDRLVASLRKVQSRPVVRFTRFDHDQEGFTGDVKGHSTGITASKIAEIYSWMLSVASGDGEEEEDAEQEEEV